MLGILLPISEYRSWFSIILYLFVGISVCKCCKYGAFADARKVDSNEGSNMVYGNLWYVFAFIILLVFSSIRSSEVGPDTKTYVELFQSQSTVSFQWSRLLSFNQYEPGFQYFNYLIRKITDNYHVYFLFVYSIVAYSYIRYIRRFYDKNSNYIFLLLFIFYYFLNLSGIRGSIGVAFLLISYVKIEDNKTLQAILLTFLSASFHYTMIYNLYIIGMVIILNNKRIERKRWVWLIVIVLVTYFSVARMSMITGLFTGTKYSNYSSVTLQDKSLLGSVFYLFSALVCLFCYKDFSRLDYRNNKQFIISLAFLITYPVLYVTSAYRIPNYYIMPRLTIWDESLSIIHAKTKLNYGQLKLIAKVVVVLYLLFRFSRAEVDGNFIYVVDF